MRVLKWISPLPVVQHKTKYTYYMYDMHIVFNKPQAERKVISGNAV